MKTVSVVLNFIAEVPENVNEELQTTLIDGRLQIGYYKPLENAGQQEFIPVITGDNISGEIATDIYLEYEEGDENNEDDDEDKPHS